MDTRFIILLDIAGHPNIINIKVQGDDQLIVDMCDTMTALVHKIDLVAKSLESLYLNLLSYMHWGQKTKSKVCFSYIVIKFETN